MQRLTSEWYMVRIIHSFKKYFTECLYVPGTILGPGESMVIKTQSPKCLQSVEKERKETDNYIIVKLVVKQSS